MKLVTLILLFFAMTVANCQGCVIGKKKAKIERYVCYDGRTLKRIDFQYRWFARRGCFKSTVPCCAYDAEHYAFTPNQERLAIALFRCRENYPFRLGEMQTR